MYNDELKYIKSLNKADFNITTLSAEGYLKEYAESIFEED